MREVICNPERRHQMSGMSQHWIRILPTTRATCASNLLRSLRKICYTTLLIRIGYLLGTLYTVSRRRFQNYQNILSMIIVAFAAAIVLVAAQRSPAINLPTKRAGIDVSLDYCISILDHHKAQIGTASQAIQVLQRLRTPETTSATHGKIQPVGMKMGLVQALTRELVYSPGSYGYTTAT